MIARKNQVSGSVDVGVGLMEAKTFQWLTGSVPKDGWIFVDSSGKVVALESDEKVRRDNRFSGEAHYVVKNGVLEFSSIGTENSRHFAAGTFSSPEVKQVGFLNLMKAVEEVAIRLGCSKITVETWIFTAYPSVMRKFGYAPQDVYQAEIQGDYETFNREGVATGRQNRYRTYLTYEKKLG